MAADADLSSRIESALAASAYLIVVCSPRSAKSRWVDQEISRFREIHGGERILTVIVDGNPIEGQESCFPPALCFEHSSGSTSRREPLAADLRPGGDGRRMVRLKLVAGMLGVNLDELVRRDDQRRHRRLVMAAAASLAGMAVTGALATAAFIARNEAQRQRAHAEGLIEFMLSDLRKKLEPSGRLDLMDVVAREALTYYQAQDPRSLDAQSLGRRARALRLMGEINVQRGDLDEALSSFEQASASTHVLLDRSPGDGHIVFNHAQNVFWVGEIARQRGDLVRAESSFRQYRSLAERLTALDPANDDWRAEVAYAQSALGILLSQEDRAAEAVAAFEGTLAVAEELARRHPDDPNRQVELGQGHAWLADALQKQGRLAEARSHAEAELAIYQTLLSKDPTLRQARYSTIITLETLGRLAMIAGDPDRALADLNESAARAEALLVGERDNMELTSLTAIVQIDLGEVLLAVGRVEPARTARQRADALLAAALAHDGSVATWRNYRDRETLLEAAIAERSGQSAEALRLDRELLGKFESRKPVETNSDFFWLMERSRLQTGDDLAALGRAQDAREQWDSIVRSLSNPAETYEPRLLVVLEGADHRLGRAAEALVIAKRLEALSRRPGGG
jgi:eukaryotic-like serine/threonine-protein kinase